MKPEILSRVLDNIELQESKLLAWGITNVGFTKAEIEEIIEAWIDRSKESDYDCVDIFNSLVAHRMLFQLPADEQGLRLFRSRSAETIRLLDTLKQIMPYHYENNELRWRKANDLVADYRYTIRPRSFPKRNIDYISVCQKLQSELQNWNSLHEGVLSKLLTKEEDMMELADFQVEALSFMLKSLNSRSEAGMIVTAGTGSGKTNAFYLPAFLHIVQKMESYGSVKALALYPRNELLKDQFTNAYELAISLIEIAKSKAGRPLSIGAIFGKVPHSEMRVLEEMEKTNRSAWRCSFLKCPNCAGELFWEKADVEARRHILHCYNRTCGHATPDDGIIFLTRNKIKSQLPDLLFTTTESLNRGMSNPSMFGSLGVGYKSTIDMVLIDEVHTYTGTHGAQVANLIRRWKSATGRSVFFAGLSATLENAVQFFSDLTGLQHGQIQQLEPKDLEEVGMEYLLALRGDPVSGSALLSTTIQTLMLMGRVVDPRGARFNFYGSKVFAFTDDLDGINRLYENFSSAEGLSGNSRPLAAYRNGQHSGDELDQFLNGQRWDIVGEIGRDCDSSLIVGRTSSQDIGVNNDADVVVATASLEVGYDDNQVGVVVQHKAPRDYASFLQRKGRAGRYRFMRPWTIVVLSDYGRDRVCYQSYEQIFNPVLPERRLPIRNPYVLRIQATFSMMDWMAKQLKNVDILNELNKDIKEPKRLDLLKLINEILDVRETYFKLFRHICKSLDLEDEEVSSIMWDEPRPIMK
ncbi:MAG: DEAD/DEAH box helicase, partial [Sphingobacteriales bacterium]